VDSGKPVGSERGESGEIGLGISCQAPVKIGTQAVVTIQLVEELEDEPRDAAKPDNLTLPLKPASCDRLQLVERSGMGQRAAVSVFEMRRPVACGAAFSFSAGRTPAAADVVRHGSSRGGASLTSPIRALWGT
jgi:hypothetical protein